MKTRIALILWFAIALAAIILRLLEVIHSWLLALLPIILPLGVAIAAANLLLILFVHDAINNPTKQ